MEIVVLVNDLSFTRKRLLVKSLIHQSFLQHETTPMHNFCRPHVLIGRKRNNLRAVGTPRW